MQQKTCITKESNNSNKDSTIHLKSLVGIYTVQIQFLNSANEVFDWTMNFQVKDIFCRESSPRHGELEQKETCSW